MLKIWNVSFAYWIQIRNDKHNTTKVLSYTPNKTRIQNYFIMTYAKRLFNIADLHSQSVDSHFPYSLNSPLVSRFLTDHETYAGNLGVTQASILSIRTKYFVDIRGNRRPRIHATKQRLPKH